MKFLYISLVLLTTVFSAAAQEKGSIVGVLSDKEANGEPLPFATVQIKNTTKGGTTDFDGLYKIDNVEPGTYTMVFSFVGYETLEIPNVNVEADKVTTVNAALGASAATLDEVVITTTTSRESEVALLLEQKNAVSIQQSIGADELSRKGVSNAAAAIAKISGVSRQSTGGNVYVRGLGDRYLNTTFNGLSLPSNDVEKKNIDLDLFTSDVIQNIDVSKAYSTKFYGDFAAGNVNVVAKDYKGKGFLDIEVGSSANSTVFGVDNFVRNDGTGYFGFYNRYDNNPFAVILSHKAQPVDAGTPINLTGSISAGKSFELGNDDRLSVMGTASFSNNFTYREGTANNYTTVYNRRFEEVEEYAYATNTTAMANLIYRAGSDHRVSFTSLFLNSSNDYVSNYGIDGNGTNRDAIRDTERGFYVNNQLFEQDMIFVNQLSGTHQLGEDFSLDWAVGYNKVFARQPDRKRFTLERYDLALDNDPATLPTYFNNTNFDNQRYFQDIEDEELNSKLNLNYKASDQLNFNFGYNGRTKERYFENIRYGLSLNQRLTEVPNVNDISGAFNVENLGNTYNTNVINAIAPELGIGRDNFPGLPENTYTGNLDIHAAYANAEFSTGDWLFVPGFRIESYTQSIVYDVINLQPSDPGFSDTYDNFYLPSLNIKYSLNEDMNLRLSASKTVSIPEFKEVTPFVYENVVSRVGGNPELLNDPSVSDIYNIDLKYEWFSSRGEVLSFAGFAKQIDNPVNKVLANDASGTRRYFRTGEAAYVLGAELEVRKNLITDADNNPNLALGLNATYMYTEQELESVTNGQFTTELDRTDNLQGASPFLINADINYTPTQFENYKPVASLVYSYFADRIDALGSGQVANIIEKGVHSLDLVFRNEIGEHWELNLSGRNLLNPDIDFLMEDTSEDGDVIISSFKNGIDMSLSLKYKF